MKLRKKSLAYLSMALCIGINTALPVSLFAQSVPQSKVEVNKVNKQYKNTIKKDGIVSQVTYERDFAKENIKGIEKVKGEGAFSLKDKTLDVVSEKEDEVILIDQNAPVLADSEVEFVFDPKNDNQDGMYGIIVRYTEDGDWTFIGQDGHSAKDPYLTSWVMCTSDGTKQKLWVDGQRIYANRQEPYTVKVRVVGDAVTLYLDNAMVYSGEVEGMTQGAGKAGVRYVNGSGANIQSFNVKEANLLEVEKSAVVEESIQSKDLKVTMDTAFPRVINYTLKETAETLGGQEAPIYVVEINNVMYRPTVTSEFLGDTATYHVSIKDLKLTFDVVYTVKDNVLDMQIKNIKEGKELVKTINFPGQALVSMESSEVNGELRVNNYREEKVVALKDVEVQDAYQTASIVTLSSDRIAASINNGNINNRQEIAYQTTKVGNDTTTGLWTNEYQYRGLDNKVIKDTLWTQVAITGDRNADGKVDFQDAAIARRDDIGTVRIGSEAFKNSYSMIAMDVGSIVQNPFLRILDNVKKFHVGTDGFGQTILIKGYQSEGHDSSHPDFANISERAGGVKDLNVLLDEASKYGADIGFHINHTEIYPEAPQWDPAILTETLGWTWYDDSVHFLRENDIMNEEDGLAKRLDDLYDIVGDRLDFIYVDTYQDSRWQAYSIAEKLNELGWAVGTEYSEELIKHSTWSHTINSKDFNYDTVGNLVRFVDHQDKDIFATSPLFRGLINRNKDAGFHGWQECKSYDETIKNFYTLVLPQKYLAHFPVSQWEKADEIVLGANNEVVTKMVNDVNEITKDGKLVAQGNTIFMPWSPIDEEKIYHWNPEGGTTTWELPNSWAQETEVKYFKLTDEGRIEEQIIPVQNNQVTLAAEKETGYVVYKGSDKTTETDLTDYDWSTGSPVKDMGFDSHTFGYAWEKSSTSGDTAHIQYVNNAREDAAAKDKEDNTKGNTHINVQGKADASLTQTMTGLVPGQTYSASVFVEGSEGRKLSLAVTTPDGKTVSNYTDSSNVAYGAPHNDRFGTYYQRVKLNFTQPEGETEAVITLKADASTDEAAWANFDNVRVTPVGVTDQKGYDYYEDFENVDQEFGPFVCPTKVTQSHLSERNGDITQDVIDGRYSLKIRSNGNVDQKFNYMRTVPHRIRFAPNTTYTVGLDYLVTDVKGNVEVLAGEAEAFVLGVKSDEALAAGDDKAAVLVQKACGVENGKTLNRVEVTFTTGNYADYYIDLLDDTYKHEFVIDNLYVNRQK